MPRPSTVLQLPDDVLSELDRRLKAQRFTDYDGLKDWLDEQGYEISRSAVGRYAKQRREVYERIQRSLDIARAISEDIGGADELGQATMAMAQSMAFDLMTDLELDAEKVDPIKLMRVVADLTKSSTLQRRWIEQYKDQVAAKLAEIEEAAAVQSADGKPAIDLETLRYIRERIYNIPAGA